MDSRIIKRQQEDARSVFADRVADAISDVMRYDVTAEAVVADLRDLLAQNPDFDSVSLAPPEPEPARCMTCGWPEHAIGQACTGLTAEEMREAVADVMAQGDEFWTKHDAGSILVERTGEWCSPGTFGSAYGTVKRAQPVGVSDGFAIVVVHGDAGEANTEFVVRLSE